MLRWNLLDEWQYLVGDEYGSSNLDEMPINSTSKAKEKTIKNIYFGVVGGLYKYVLV
jgi:hypothetical protein